MGAPKPKQNTSTKQGDKEQIIKNIAPQIPVNDSKQQQLQYYDILNKNDDILRYDAYSHPKPQYFPYQHDEKNEELNEEGPDAWNQFDDDESDQDDDDLDVHIEVDENKKVRVYREYKERRMICKQQIDELNKHKKIKAEHVLIAMAGDGSMGGQLGVGNGSNTKIRDNISPFPFILKSLKNKQIKLTAAGIMSTAIVTDDNQIYVWGLNDKSELTINPVNSQQVDVGDDDDQLSPDVAWNRLYAHYFEKITNIYQEHNPDRLEKDESFVKNLLFKRKVGKITMTYRGKTEIKEGSLNDQQQIALIV